uniref:Putative ixostatin n=1 Tax=Ixodes ricinus TaxID=34613 RepID=A0A0K8RJ30_IXORI
MIPTKCFLVLAMLPITCLMVQQTLPKGCTPVNFDSFHNTTNKTTLPNVLGMYCNASYIKQNWTGPWIGIAGPTIAQCTICCVHKHKNKTLLYLSTKAPNLFPCGKGKKCNTHGRCVKTKKT